MTLPEKLLWAELRKLDLNFRRPCPIGRFVVDFACHGPRLVVEIDGPHHDFPERQLHDLKRTAWLELQGYRVVRFSNHEVMDQRDEVVAAIVGAVSPRALSSASAVRSPPTPALPPSRGKGEM